MMFRREITGYLTSCIIIILYMENVLSKPHCIDNERVFSEVGSNATFFALKIQTDPDKFRTVLFLHETDRLLAVLPSRASDLHISYYNTRERFVVFGHLDKYSETPGNLTIILQNVTDKDNGTYMLVVDYRKSIGYCWTLFVLKPPTTPVITSYIGIQEKYIVEEGETVTFSGSQSSSTSIPSGLKVSMAWLVDGVIVSSRGTYRVTDDNMLILHTDRRLNGKNVTYRATEENGMTNEVNYTFNIAYGPDPYLILKPDTSVYFVTEGDDISTVTCAATCFPPCITIWTSDKLSENITGRQLNLGKATVAMSDDYSCMATRNGTYKTAKRTITVEVKVKETVDNTSVIVLDSLLGITVVGLVALTVFVLFVLRPQMSSCIQGVKERKTDTDKAINSRVRITTPQGISNDVAMDTYTDLQSDSRDVHVETIYDPIETEVIQTGQLTYENTSLPKLKYES